MPTPNAHRSWTRLCSLTAALAFLLPTGAAIFAAPATAAPTAGWSWESEIDSTTTTGIWSPRLAVGADGTAAAAFTQYTEGTWWLAVAQYRPDGGWGAAQLLKSSTSSSTTDAAAVAKGPNGVVFALGALYTDSNSHIYAFRYDPAVGWDQGQKLDTEGLGDSSQPRMAAGLDGSATVVWLEGDGVRDNLWQSRYVAGSGWTTAAKLETEDGGSMATPAIAAQADGSAMVVWSGDDGSHNNAYSNKFTQGVGWSGATLLETTDNETAYATAVAADEAGGFWAVWSQDGTTGYNLYARHDVAGSGWGATELAEKDDSVDAYTPSLAVDGLGQVIVAYSGYDGLYHTWSNRRSAAGVWGTGARLDNPSDDSGVGSSVGVGPNGEGVIVYVQYVTGSYRMRSRAFDAAGTLGPELPVASGGTGVSWPQVIFAHDGFALCLWANEPGSFISAMAATYTARDVTRPALAVSEPLPGAQVDEAVVFVAGTAEPGAAVAVNGLAASTDADGAFALVVPVSPGTYFLYVTATDAWGNVGFANFPINVSDPGAGLEAEVAAANANATAAAAAAAAAQAQAAAAQAQLAQAQAAIQHGDDVSASQNSTIAALQAQLAATSASLNTTQATVAATKPAAGDSLGMILGLLGVILGGAALAMSFMRKGGGGGGGGSKGNPDSRLSIEPKGDQLRLEPAAGAGQGSGVAPHEGVER